MNFTPDQNRTPALKVPFYEDVSSEDGWQGHTTSKKLSVLEEEIKKALARLGGQAATFQYGLYQAEMKSPKRQGCQVRFIIDAGEQFHKGRIDIAALPVRAAFTDRIKINNDKSLRMALYMMRDALNGAWFMQQLSPGYAPLMPFMLTSSDKTITELWSKGVAMKNLLPPGDAEFIVDGQFREVG